MTNSYAWLRSRTVAVYGSRALAEAADHPVGALLGVAGTTDVGVVVEDGVVDWTAKRYADKAAAEVAAADLLDGTLLYSEADEAVTIVLGGEAQAWSNDGSLMPTAYTAGAADWVEAPFELGHVNPGLPRGNTISGNGSTGANWTYV